MITSISCKVKDKIITKEVMTYGQIENLGSMLYSFWTGPYFIEKLVKNKNIIRAVGRNIEKCEFYNIKAPKIVFDDVEDYENFIDGFNAEEYTHYYFDGEQWHVKNQNFNTFVLLKSFFIIVNIV
jgi:hypothetical protein